MLWNFSDEAWGSWYTENSCLSWIMHLCGASSKRTKGDNKIKNMSKVNIKLSAYESQLVDQAAIKVIQAIKAIGIKYSGPVPLPTKYEEFTILRSVHVNKKSREQFERRTHKRLIVLKDSSKELLDKLQRTELPAGVNIQIVAK